MPVILLTQYAMGRDLQLWLSFYVFWKEEFSIANAK
jgi:hypothetical protein